MARIAHDIVRIIVVEDHVDTATMLAKLLSVFGYEVELASTAAEALALASAQPFHVIVSDVGLPDATGYDLMRRIRERTSIRGIAMSGYGSEDHIRKSREAGFREHLVKPVSVERLNDAIRHVLEHDSEP